jgi:hypothetical protein
MSVLDSTTNPGLRAHRLLSGQFNLSPEQVSEIVGCLIESSLLKTTEISSLQSAADRQHNLQFVEAVATARRLGLEPNGEGQIDDSTFQRRMRGSSVQERMRLKSLFASAGIMA